MIDKYFLRECLVNGMSTREIAQLTGYSKSAISNSICKYNLQEFNQNYPKPAYRFNVIDTPAKAYTLGFILCDAGISDVGYVFLNTSIDGSQPAQFIAHVLETDCEFIYKYNPITRVFPKCKVSKKIVDILKFIGGPKKDQRHFPRIREDLEVYLMRGVFDADGCITWGRRKDRNRIWQKVSFKSSYSILYGVQQFLYRKLGIPTIIHPVKGENCFELSFSDKDRVLYFLSWLYQDPSTIIYLKKYQKYRALRLELEENGGTKNLSYNTVASLQSQEAVETTGWVARPIQYQISLQGNNDYF